MNSTETVRTADEMFILSRMPHNVTPYLHDLSL